MIQILLVCAARWRVFELVSHAVLRGCHFQSAHDQAIGFITVFESSIIFDSFSDWAVVLWIVYWIQMAQERFWLCSYVQHLRVLQHVFRLKLLDVVFAEWVNGCRWIGWTAASTSSIKSRGRTWPQISLDVSPEHFWVLDCIIEEIEQMPDQ